MWMPVLLAALAPLGFRVESTEFATAVFHVNCLTGAIPCSKTAIETFWRDDLHWTAEDDRQLQRWSRAVQSATDRQPRGPESPFVPSATAFYPRLAAARAIIAAALDSRSAAEFRSRARTLASPVELAHLAATLEHFDRRLHPWWKTKAEPMTPAPMRSLQARLNQPDIRLLAARLSRFTESAISSGDFHVHLVPRTDSVEGSNGTVVGRHVLIELNHQYDPKFSPSIVLHEFTHALFNAAPPERHRELIRAFADAPQPQSQALYALLNEELATAVQALVIHDPAVTAADLYNHPFIGRIALATAPLLQAALDNGGTLFDGFPDAYLRAGTAEMRDEAASPRFILSSVALAPIGDLDLAIDAFHEGFSAVNGAGFGDRDRYPELNIVFLITYDKLGTLDGNSWEGELAALSKSHRGFAFSAPRNRKGRIYVLAARDEATLVEVVRLLAAMRSGVPDGLVVGVE